MESASIPWKRKQSGIGRQRVSRLRAAETPTKTLEASDANSSPSFEYARTERAQNDFNVHLLRPSKGLIRFVDSLVLV